jgi:hypothetical protein
MSIELDTTFYYDQSYNTYQTPYEVWETKKHCYFYYYDKTFGKFDWKTEPDKSLQDLYLERAKQIRDDYDYVILCYSGGNDSSNILETFYYNNIHIDEIVVVGALSQDNSKGSDENHNADVYFNAIPTLNSMDLPNTKITVIDYTKFFSNINQFSLIKEQGADYFKYIGTHTSPHNLFWRDFRSFVGKGNNKKTAWIMGAEKVELDYTPNGHPYAYFKDTTVFNYGMRHIDENFERINFYNGYHDTAVNIQIKQAHVLHQALSKITDKKQKRDLTASRFLKNKLFYEKKHIKLAHQSEKSRPRFLSLRDMFIKNVTNSEIYSVYKDGLKTHYSYCQSGIKVISKPYYIT